MATLNSERWFAQQWLGHLTLTGFMKHIAPLIAVGFVLAACSRLHSDSSAVHSLNSGAAGTTNPPIKILTTKDSSSVATGAFSEPVISYTWSESLMSRQIRLSPKHPADSDIKIRLVSVASDSTTTIRLDSGEQLSAKPGDYFTCEQFGTHGLELVSASHEAGEAQLRLHWSETRVTR